MEKQHTASTGETTSDQTRKTTYEPARVAILVCTFNGVRFLKEQLESFIRQAHKNWVIYVSDDGSTDGTLEILKQYQILLGVDRVFIFHGPRQGFGKNFFSLINNREILADYFAFSDQDDVWHDDKLSKAISSLSSFDPQKPLLYCSRTQLIDSKGRTTGFSPLFTKPPCFRNALVQSIAGANTMLMNSRARRLLQQVDGDANVIVAHDWLAYLVISGCGGTVVYDPESTLNYRQHDGNLIGANASLANQISRIRKMLSGRFKEWTSNNLSALACVSNQLTKENQQLLLDFELARNSYLFKRIRLMKKTRVYRQTLKGNISLKVAVVFNKI